MVFALGGISVNHEYGKGIYIEGFLDESRELASIFLTTLREARVTTNLAQYVPSRFTMLYRLA